MILPRANRTNRSIALAAMSRQTLAEQFLAAAPSYKGLRDVADEVAVYALE